VFCVAVVALLLGACAADDAGSSAEEPSTSADEELSANHWYRITIPSDMCTPVGAEGPKAPGDPCNMKFPPDYCFKLDCPSVLLRSKPWGATETELEGGDKVFLYGASGGWAHVGYATCAHGKAQGGYIPTKYLPKKPTTAPPKC
jgi:hypothetical protein